MSDSLWPHEQQHARLPCPSLSPGVCSNSCPLSWWCHLTISYSVVPFSSRLPSIRIFFLRSQFFEWDGQSIEASALASVLPMNIQDWFPLGLIGLISLPCKGLSKTDSLRDGKTAERSPRITTVSLFKRSRWALEAAPQPHPTALGFSSSPECLLP